MIASLGLAVSAASLIANIGVSQQLDTVLIKVTARAGTPLAAQQLADAWVAALTKHVAAIENPRGVEAANTLHIVPIDGDLRRPSVADSFGLVEGAGLTDVLIGRATFEDVAQRSARHPHLQVLAAGGMPPNPSEMLGSRATRNLLARLAVDDFVIINASPLLPVTDAALLTASADGAFIVISAGRTLDTELQSALKHLEAVNGKTLGVILNRVSSHDSARGYYEADETASATGTSRKSRELVAKA